MKHILTHILHLLALVNCSTLLAQVDTTVILPEMQVERVRQAAIGLENYIWDSAVLQSKAYSSLADFLLQESNIYIKSYGGNSLSTVSIQGASASQTLLLWNGLPVQSPMLGLLDLSLVPVSFSDEISLQVGGNSSSWGSGAIGGVIGITNQASYTQNFELDYFSSIASFSNLQQRLKIAAGNKKFQSVSKLSFQKGKNDILVRPAPNVDNYRQRNAAFLQLGILQSFYLKPNNKNELIIHAWVQESDKEIPPTLTQRNSEAYQTDNFKRFMGLWKFTFKKHLLQTRIGHYRERQFFNDPQIQLEALNKFNTTLGELNYTFQVNRRHKLEFAGTTTRANAYSQSYQGEVTQLKIAGLISYKYSRPKTQVQLSLREEWIDKQFLLPFPYFGVKQALGDRLILKLKISREFRLPTLNDLYWNPGGNIELKPERGWSQEIGLAGTWSRNRHSIAISSSIFNRNIEDWILWAPSDIGFFWSASNIAKVWSYGSTTKLDYKYHKHRFSFQAGLGFDYTKSSYRIDLDLPKLSKGDQLFYTPIYQSTANISLQISHWAIQYQHQVVGETIGANDAIPRYHVGNVHFTYHFNQSNFSGKIFTSIQNIYNQNYIVVERRPMPGINAQFGININLKK